MNRATKRNLRFAASLILLLAIVALPAAAKNLARAKKLALEQFHKAEKMREALNGTPPEERTRREYQRVTDAYRRVYYTAPTSTRAEAAASAVGELLAETGRQFNDKKMLEAAIGQFEFLRREYPGSKYRVAALFTIGQIYKEDLKDKEKAKAAFEEFLKRFPAHKLVDECRDALAELAQPEKPAKKARAESKLAKQEVKPETKPDREQSGRLPLVTGVRHWSTPDYTRVAIDLETEVKYEAGRIARPDRIFFDLHGTKLSSTLLGKAFDVQDGFLRRVRVAQFQRDMTRIVLEVNDVSEYSAFLLPNPYRLIIDVHGKPKTAVAKKEAPAPQSTQAPAETAKPEQTTAATITPTQEPASKKAEKKEEARKEIAEKASEKKISQVEQVLKKDENADQAEDTTIEVAKATEPELKATKKPTSEPTFEAVEPRTSTKSSRRTRKLQPENPAKQARSLANGERSLIRALGLKIGKIVVDAGHGGHDTGTIGPGGLQEKDLVLDVALRLGKLLESKLGADVVYTREDDTFVPLETRTAMANQHQADLFISIHANASRDESARGVETYYLNFTSSPEALEVAARENAVSEKSIHELQDLVKKITLKDKIDESREFAAEVQKALHAGIAARYPAVRNRGVKKAPFIVLIGANMPSILAEVSFLSNPLDEQRLQRSDYRQRIAEYLYRGISRYVNGLSGLKVASKTSVGTSSQQAAR